MKGSKKATGSMAALIMSVALLSACGQENGTAPGDNGSGGGQTASAGPVKIEALVQAGSVKMPPAEQDVIRQGLESKLGIELKQNVFMGTLDDYNNQLNVRLATSDMPDLFFVSSRTMLKDYAEKGILLDLTPYMDQLKDYAQYAGADSVDAGKVNGKQFGIVKPQAPNQISYWIRKDWLDKLGMKVPTTLDEFYETAKAFLEKDPDGNGKNDTYALTGTGIGTFSPLFGAYGTLNPGTIMIKDGKVISTYQDPAMKEALAYIKKLTDAKLVDPEFMSNKVPDVQQKLFQGQYGIAFIHWPAIVKEDVRVQWQKINPQAQWIQLSPPQGPGGSYNSEMSAISAGGIFALPKSLEKQPEKIKKALELVNYTATKEGSRLVWYGVEGKHYNLEGDKVVPTPLMSSEGGYFSVYQFTGSNQEYLKTKFADLESYINFSVNIPRLKAYSNVIVYPPSLNTADINRYGEEEIIKFIYGKTPLDKYGDFLTKLDTTYNYKAVLQEAEKQLREQQFLK
ncbi:MAG: transporter substrate-binding protein [Paenibacillaceae bacterium]|jgi:putative aldouronate transport system substrate-binding protein|nr:transporter substrate-binding protein [Paenibacillaceae bacterium]